MAKRVPLNRLREISKQRGIRRGDADRPLSSRTTDKNVGFEWPIGEVTLRPEDHS
jgi:hypothetical protein